MPYSRDSKEVTAVLQGRRSKADQRRRGCRGADSRAKTVGEGPSVWERAKKKAAATTAGDLAPASAAAASQVLPLGRPGTASHQDGQPAFHRPSLSLFPPQVSLSPSAGDHLHSTSSLLQHPWACLLVKQDSGILDLSQWVS